MQEGAFCLHALDWQIESANSSPGSTILRRSAPSLDHPTTTDSGRAWQVTAPVLRTALPVVFLFSFFYFFFFVFPCSFQYFLVFPFFPFVSFFLYSPSLFDMYSLPSLFSPFHRFVSLVLTVCFSCFFPFFFPFPFLRNDHVKRVLFNDM